MKNRSAKFPRDPERSWLEAELYRLDIPLAEMSRRIGKNHAYLQQWLERGVPKELPERVRSRIVEELGIEASPQVDDERNRTLAGTVTKSSQIRSIGEYNALVSAGGGILLGDEEKTGEWPLPRPYLEEMNLSGNGLAVVPVKGDSMEPTLRSGDRVLIDMGDKNVSQGGLFVLWDGTGRVVKRVERVPGIKPPLLALISDNPLHSKYQVSAIDVEIVGRVVWAARRL